MSRTSSRTVARNTKTNDRCDHHVGALFTGVPRHCSGRPASEVTQIGNEMGMKLSHIGGLRSTSTDKIWIVTCKFGLRDTWTNAPQQSSEPSVGGSNPSSRTKQRMACRVNLK